MVMKRQASCSRRTVRPLLGLGTNTVLTESFRCSGENSLAHVLLVSPLVSSCDGSLRVIQYRITAMWQRRLAKKKQKFRKC